jgi:hypothetical protein
MPFETSTADNRIAPAGSIWRPSGDPDAPIGPRRPLVWNPFDMAGQRHLLPVTAAIRRALALPAATIIRTAVHPPTDMVAMEVVIYRTVASAISGDTKAIALIADRIEGRPGLRMSHNESDDPARRQRVQAAMATVVRHMVERAAGAPNIGAENAPADNAQ